MPMTSDDQTMAAWQALAPLMDLVTPMALRVAATLRLADFMPDDGTSEGAVLGDLAERAGADPEALARVLHHLVQHGVFTEPRPGQFAANQTAALLRTGRPGAVWLDLDGFGGQMDLAFTGLAHTVRTGEPAWEQVFGQPFWAYLDANPAISASFDATMAVDAGNTPRNAGVASGLISMGRQAGGALGLAALVTAASTVTRQSHSSGPVPVVHGYHIALLAAAAVSLATATISLFLSGDRSPSPAAPRQRDAATADISLGRSQSARLFPLKKMNTTSQFRSRENGHSPARVITK
jgi:hypothetical protein